MYSGNFFTSDAILLRCGLKKTTRQVGNMIFSAKNEAKADRRYGRKMPKWLLR